MSDACDHIKTTIVGDYTKECLDCGEQFCTHPKIDFDSTCLVCGEYQTQICIEQVWADTYNNANTIIKNTKDHIKTLETIGYPNEIIESTMDKFSKVGCSLSEEPAVLAVCVWLSYWDHNQPKTMSELSKKHSITKAKIKKARQIVLSLEYFSQYRTKYVTISMMVTKLITDLGINQRYHPHMLAMAKFVEDNWDKSMHTRRCAPQNVAAGCVFLYLMNSPSLKFLINTPTKKKQICAVMGPSCITIDKIVKQLGELFINVPEIIPTTKK
uniref:Transcription factor TFIIB cyclin-like domain-containing protein n=1 Tax=viral metagenome TaxID=1070528 RepID=A0A6C0JRK2_9ZZZZ